MLSRHSWVCLTTYDGWWYMITTTTLDCLERRIPRPWISENSSPSHIKGQLLSQRGRRKSDLVILSRFVSSRMCIIVLRFCQTLRDGKDWKIVWTLQIFYTTALILLDPDATKLAKELDGLPLALATTGTYLDQVAISLSDYLCLYKESWMQLQKSSPELSSYEDRTLYST